VRISFITLTLLGSMMSFAYAQTAPKEWDVSVGAGGIFFDGDRNYDEDPILSLGVGYRLTPHWGLEGRLGGFEADGDAPVEDADGLLYQLDGLYHFTPTAGVFEPFLAAGLGQIELDAEGADDDFALNLGAGFKHAISKAWYWRGDARVYESLDSSNRDGLILLSLGHVFGHPTPAPVPLDSDGDGVPDANDQCPQSPAGAIVDANGCTPAKPEAPKDSDQDGVIDTLDQCPGTPTDVVVDAQGCPKLVEKQVTIRLNVQFATDKAVVTPAYYPEIEKVAEFMAKHPGTQVVIEGHTDASGLDSYNLLLSQRRADAVKTVLVNEFAIDAARIEAKGFGETRPIADNNSAAGRQQNRRVDAVLSTKVQVTEVR